MLEFELDVMTIIYLCIQITFLDVETTIFSQHYSNYLYFLAFGGLLAKLFWIGFLMSLK
jgi:hypothetical protein